MHPREKRLAELQAMIESAKAEIKQIQADEQAEKAETETGKAMNFKAAASEIDRGLTGNRDADGNFVPENVDGAPMNFKEAAGEKSGIEVPVEISSEDLDAQSFDKKQYTDAEFAKMKRTSNDPVESITRSDGSELEMDGGRAAAKEDESVERTMGFETDEGGIMSVDEKDDYWKTQEGYDKALEMYGRKPAWIEEPTLQWNSEEQKYEKIEEEEFEDLSSPAMSADVKALFG
jgi:hypothetical protein